MVRDEVGGGVGLEGLRLWWREQMWSSERCEFVP